VGNGNEDPVAAALATLAGSGKKYVPESDLIAAKKGLDGKIGTLESELTTTKASLDAKHDALLKETAAKEAVEAKVSEASALKEKIDKLTKELGEATTGRDQITKKLVDLKRLAIHQRTKGKMTMEDLGKKTEEHLDSLIESLDALSPETKGQQTYDDGTGGTGGTAPKGGRSLIKAGLGDRDR